MLSACGSSQLRVRHKPLGEADHRIRADLEAIRQIPKTRAVQGNQIEIDFKKNQHKETQKRCLSVWDMCHQRSIKRISASLSQEYKYIYTYI